LYFQKDGEWIWIPNGSHVTVDIFEPKSPLAPDRMRFRVRLALSRIGNYRVDVSVGIDDGCRFEVKNKRAGEQAAGWNVFDAVEEFLLN
jgi:hypothetical protein